jgi:hypothetical protein
MLFREFLGEVGVESFRSGSGENAFGLAVAQETAIDKDAGQLVADGPVDASCRHRGNPLRLKAPGLRAGAARP